MARCTLKKIPRVAPRGKVGYGGEDRELHILKTNFKKLKRRQFASVTGTENRTVRYLAWQQICVLLRVALLAPNEYGWGEGLLVEIPVA